MAGRVRAIRPIELVDGRRVLPGTWLDELPAAVQEALVEAGEAAVVDTVKTTPATKKSRRPIAEEAE